jgi:hypothetical protein
LSKLLILGLEFSTHLLYFSGSDPTRPAITVSRRGRISTYSQHEQATPTNTTMSHVHVQRFGSCVVVRMTNESNVLTPQFIEELHSALDAVER